MNRLEAAEKRYANLKYLWEREMAKNAALVAALEAASAWFRANYSFIEHDVDAMQMHDDIDTALAQVGE